MKLDSNMTYFYKSMDWFDEVSRYYCKNEPLKEVGNGQPKEGLYWTVGFKKEQNGGRKEEVSDKGFLIVDENGEMYLIYDTKDFDAVDHYFHEQEIGNIKLKTSELVKLMLL